MRLTIIILIFTSIASLGHSETLVFFDGEFDSSNYTEYTQGEGTSSAWTETVGGYPDEYRRISLTVSPKQDVLNAQIFGLAQFTPGIEGSINSAMVSYEVRRVYNSIPSATLIVRGVAVEQDGVVYKFNGGATSSTTWEYFEIENIVPLFPSVNWIDGNTITFGFYDYVYSASSSFTIDGGYDNFRVEIDYNPPTVVELTSLLLRAFNTSN